MILRMEALAWFIPSSLVIAFKKRKKKKTEIANCIQLGDGNAFFHIFLWDISPFSLAGDQPFS